MDDLPIHSICALAGSLVGLLFCAAAAAEDRFMKTSCSTSTNKSSDEVLVAATKRGDARAFEELVLRHRQKVVAVAIRISNNLEVAADSAQDSIQNAFILLYA